MQQKILMKQKKNRNGKSRVTPKTSSNTDKRKIIRTLKPLQKADGGNFTSMKIQYLSEIYNITTSIVRNVLNKNGYALTPARIKTIFLATDLPKHLHFAENVFKSNKPTFWTNDICFYLDGRKSVH